MSYRFRTDPYAPAARPATTRVARNAMLAMLVAFVIVTLLFFFLGDIDQSVAPQVIAGPTYQQLKQDFDQRLTTYGWVDREAGAVHIPIERAIELTAERGLPARANQTTANP